MTQSQWKDHIEQQKQSGLTIAEYCKKHSLSPKSFYNARNRYKSNSFVHVNVINEAPECKTIPSPKIVIQCRNTSIEALNISPEWLAQFVGALA